MLLWPFQGNFILGRYWEFKSTCICFIITVSNIRLCLSLSLSSISYTNIILVFANQILYKKPYHLLFSKCAVHYRLVWITFCMQNWFFVFCKSRKILARSTYKIYPRRKEYYKVLLLLIESNNLSVFVTDINIKSFTIIFIIICLVWRNIGIR